LKQRRVEALSAVQPDRDVDPRWFEIALQAVRSGDAEFDAAQLRRVLALCPHPRRAELLLDALLEGVIELDPTLVPWIAETRDQRAIPILKGQLTSDSVAMLGAVAAALRGYGEPALEADARSALVRAADRAMHPRELEGIASQLGSDPSMWSPLREIVGRKRRLTVKGAQATQSKNEVCRALLRIVHSLRGG
jgi:hypothetical protein